MRHPTFHRHAIHILIRRSQIKLFRAPAIPHHVPRISSPLRLMNNDATSRPQFRRLLKFVSPPPVISHSLAAKHPFIRHRRIINQNHYHFPAHIHALKIVPFIFRRLHSISNKHHLRLIQPRRIHHPLSPSHKILLKRSMQHRPMPSESKRHRRIRPYAHKRHLLQKGTIRIPSLQPRSPELLLHITNAQHLALSPRPPPLKLIRRKHLDMRKYPRRINRSHRLPHPLRKSKKRKRTNEKRHNPNPKFHPRPPVGEGASDPPAFRPRFF